MKEYRLDVPQVTLLAHELKQAGVDIPDGILTTEELVEMPYVNRIKKCNIYIQSLGTAYEIHALKDINLNIPDGQFIGVIGHTGSGKSTLIQHLNGLIQPTSGTVSYNGEDVWAENYNLTRTSK